MDNLMAVEVRYQDHQRQAMWINEESWKFERPEKRYRVRQAMAKVLIHLATLLTPARQETYTA